MRILYRNLVDDYDPADYSSERANLWATNVKIHHLIVPWRTQLPDAQFYILDAGAGNTITADCAAIAGHNLTAAATIHIQAHPANAWGAPDLDESFTWGAGPMMAFFASTAKRFWRFYLDDPANPDAYIQIGRLGLGVALQMPPVEPGVELPVMTTSVPSTSPTGQVFGRRGQLLFAPAFSLPIISEAERQAILTMFAEVHNLDPFFMLTWEDSVSVQGALYCRIDQEELAFKKSAESGVLWNLELRFREVR